MRQVPASTYTSREFDVDHVVPDFSVCGSMFNRFTKKTMRKILVLGVSKIFFM